jgi:hypothetical protein
MRGAVRSVRFGAGDVFVHFVTTVWWRAWDVGRCWWA